jgi:ring-1,2-phenylacetyl-CoA epoxidase subunit PaaD
MNTPSVAQLYNWLDEVKDPEIPVLSLVDLGVITSIRVEGEKVYVEMTPTFVGCPALEVMKQEIVSALQRHGIAEVEITVSFREPWSSEKISERGKEALKKFGISPPPSGKVFTDLELLDQAVCPRCSGTHTEIKNIFGPTLCRSIHYCFDCQEAFEQFKPL